MSEKILAMMRRKFTAIDAWDKHGYFGRWLRVPYFGGWKQVIWRGEE